MDQPIDARKPTFNSSGYWKHVADKRVVDICVFIVAIFGGFIYFCLSPIFDLLGYAAVRILPPHKNHHKKSEAKSEGVISRHSKNGNSYVTRFLDPKRDCPDAAAVLAHGFCVDPVSEFLQPDNALRHAMMPLWYKGLVESRNFDVIVQEWEEQEKIVGVVVFEVREPSMLQTFLDECKQVAHLFRIGFFSPSMFYRTMMLSVVLPAKADAVCKPWGDDVAFVKFVAVEKGFQGNGIGSNLLRHALEHIDALECHAYLESSSPANVPLYERFGFRLLETWHMLPGSPPFYLMIREHSAATPVAAQKAEIQNVKALEVITPERSLAPVTEPIQKTTIGKKLLPQSATESAALESAEKVKSN